MSNALTVSSSRELLFSRKDEYAMALAGRIDPDVFLRVAHQAVTKSPQLLQCTPGSLLMAFSECASLGLMPSGPLGEAYIIPYRNKGALEAQFMPGYRGLVTLCRRSGGVKNILPYTIHEGDDYRIEYGSEPRLHHSPTIDTKRRGDAVAFYAVATLPDGSSTFRLMTMDEVKAIQKRSKSSGGPWTTDFEAMAWKTVIRQMVKYLPMATEEIARALEADNRDFDASRATDRRAVDSLNAALLPEADEPSPAKTVTPEEADEYGIETTDVYEAADN